jgi:uncharacterized ubiquitin-like protein YukD
MKSPRQTAVQVRFTNFKTDVYDLSMIQQNYCKKNIEIQLNVDSESSVTKFFNISI